MSSVVKSLAEAYVFLDHAWPRLIYDGDRLVGFLMAFLDIPWDPDNNPDDHRSGLWRLNIAPTRRATGTGRSPPEPYYLKLGLRPTGELSGGETVGVLDL